MTQQEDDVAPTICGRDTLEFYEFDVVSETDTLEAVMLRAEQAGGHGYKYDVCGECLRTLVGLVKPSDRTDILELKYYPANDQEPTSNAPTICGRRDPGVLVYLKVRPNEPMMDILNRVSASERQVCLDCINVLMGGTLRDKNAHL